MKSFKIIMLACCFVVFGFAFAGCGCNVDQPVVSIEGCYAVWQPVSNASGYEVVIDDNPHFNTTDTSVNLITYLQKGNIKEIKVRALGKGFFHFNSEYSESQSVSVADERLAAPTGFEVREENKVYKAIWNAVAVPDLEDEVKYCLCFVDENNKEYFFQTKQRNFDINGNLGGYGRFTVRVFAYIDDISKFAPSEFSAEQHFDYLTLTNTVQGIDLDNKTLSWNNVSGINAYNVNLLGGGTQRVEANKDASNNKTSYDISDLVENKVCAFVGVQAVSSSEQYNSPYSNFLMWYKSDITKEDLSDCNYSYAGSDFDLCADNYTELKNIIHFAIFYRIENMMFTVSNNYAPKYNGSICDQGGVCDINYAIKSYAEIMNISYKYQSKTNGFEKFFLDITFNHPEYARKITPMEGSYTQFEPKKENGADWQLPNVSHLSEGDAGYRGSEFDSFPVKDRTKEVMIYTSDQLYFVLDKGYEPVFPSICPAKLAYDAAKNVLRKIINNGMTDYEKTLAIFEWLCYNVKYDMNLYALANDQEKSKTIHNYRGFYIEGVLFDNGKAVCDGIAKTFSLMCGLENIECYKAIGLVNEGGSHAWNKVNLQVPNSSAKKWYVVDATWSDFTPREDTTEYFSHRYFLKTDAELNKHYEALTQEYFDYLRPILSAQGKEIPQYDLDRKDEGVKNATTTFNYYQTVEHGNVNNILDLEDLKNYVSGNHLTYFEFKSSVKYQSHLYNINGYECKSLNSVELSDTIYVYIKQ